MPNQWVIYIPRPRDQANLKDGGKPSLITKAETWKTKVESKLVTPTTGESTTPVAKYTFSVKCLGEKLPGVIGGGDVIYVYGGHGVAGRNAATWPGDSNPLDAATLVQRLLDEGLPGTFDGRIKVYSCYSGDGGGKALAKLFATALRKGESGERFAACTVYGYHGEITQAYELIDLKKMVHKAKYRGPVEDAGDHRWSIQTGGYAGRTSKHRDKF